MDIRTLITTTQATPDCLVNPPAGYPSIREGHVLPADLVLFYHLCGGVTLFQHADFPFFIVSPLELVPANPVLLPELSEEQVVATKNHPSWSWYIIATDGSTEYITIDLSQERLGKCYDSFWDIYPGNSTVVALSFTELLMRLLKAGGQNLYSGEPGFGLMDDSIPV